MKERDAEVSSKVNSKSGIADSSKLVSLLALAAGAVAMPQTSHADIIYTDLSASPVVVGFGGTNQFTFSGLPGGAQFGFQTRATSRKTQPYGAFTIRYHTVSVAQMGGTAQAGLLEKANGFAVPEPKSAVVSPGASFYLNVPVGTQSITYSGRPHGPNSYNHEYLAWGFYDTAQSANRFGWVEIGLSVGSTNDPNVTVYGYAYDNQGNPIPMGQVPEPAPMGILALGALALGAKGVRVWRRNRAAVCKS